MSFTKFRRYLPFAVVATVLLFGIGTLRQSKAQAPDRFTPGMLFGPVYVGPGQRLELCSSNLGEGTLKAFIHFRNFNTAEVTANQELTLNSGGGDCAIYQGIGRVVGMARGDGAAADWVSPSNPLISTMSLVDSTGTRVAVLGVPKVWLRGL